MVGFIATTGVFTFGFVTRRILMIKPKNKVWLLFDTTAKAINRLIPCMVLAANLMRFMTLEVHYIHETNNWESN